MTRQGDLQRLEKGCVYSLHRVSKFVEPSLLLLLSKKASHGYELIERLEELGFHRESIDIGSVYRTLRKLEKEGFVRSSWEKAAGKKKKRDYLITPEGLRFLARWAERIEERKRALAKFMRIYQQL
jgi:PadR family transcriptional regulator, regulatory protein PadR